MTDFNTALRALGAVPQPAADVLHRSREALLAQIAGGGANGHAAARRRGIVTVVGGGLGGLLAAIALAESGLRVTMHEARPRLGGRAGSLDGDYVVNWGPHALYADGALWRWLEDRELLPEVVEPALEAGVVFRRHGVAADAPMDAFVAAAELSGHVAPTDVAFRPWAASIAGDDVARDLSSLAGVFSFHHDPGALAAPFVMERLARVSSMPPAARFVVGGWQRLVDALATRALALGVTITLESPVRELPDGVAVLAVPLPVAARLLGDDTVTWSESRAVLLDVALRIHPDDPYAIWDLDEAGWAETYTHRDPSLAPDGEHLVQAQLGLRPGESMDDGVARVEALLDAGYPDWRSREVWRRRGRIEGQTGAVDLPGTTWRDRPEPDRGNGVFVVGDAVAAPGLLSEVIMGAVEQVAARVPDLVVA